MNRSMASSMLSSSSTARNCRRKKKTTRKVQHQSQSNYNSTSPIIEWDSDGQQQIYSSKLLHTLRQLRLNNTDSSNPKMRMRMRMRVREAADRVLAATAKGRWRWSSAILKNRLKLNKFIKKNNVSKRQRRMMTPSNKSRLLIDQKKSKVSVMRLKSMSLGGVERRVRTLSRLVPGCRKQPLNVVLQEATEYIPALQMQVRAMSALAELLSSSGS